MNGIDGLLGRYQSNGQTDEKKKKGRRVGGQAGGHCLSFEVLRLELEYFIASEWLIMKYWVRTFGEKESDESD